MALKRNDLTAWQIHWGLKSDSLAELAARLGLGLDSFVFLDDDPVQCAEVRRRFPEVLALQVPDKGIETFCRHIWPLDRRARTREGSRRTGAYREHVAREDVRASSLSFQQFLDSLALEIDIAPLEEEDLPRATELTYRTNQFNLTGRRVNEAEFRQQVLHEGTPCFGVRVRDRFGDYGLVGLILAERSGRELHVPIMLLSCRSLGRGVEHRMVAHLGRLARDLDAARIRLHCVPSERNDPAREFLHQLDEVVVDEDGTLIVTLEADRAASVQLELDAAPQPSGAPDARSVATDPVAEGDKGRRMAFLATIPTALGRAGAIHAAVHDTTSAPGLGSMPEAVDEGAEALDPIVGQLTGAFSDLLGMAEIPADVGFFELGGQSLQAMQILAQFSEAFGIELAPTLLFTTNFTVSELAEEIGFLRGGDDAAQDDVSTPNSSTPGR